MLIKYTGTLIKGGKFIPQRVVNLFAINVKYKGNVGTNQM